MESNKRKKTKMTIEQAMVQLLKEKSFEYISTVELAKTAGISRSSFYTHYKDKYDLIERYQQGLFQKLETIFEEYYNDPTAGHLKGPRLPGKRTSFLCPSVGKWDKGNPNLFKTQVSNDASPRVARTLQ